MRWRQCAVVVLALALGSGTAACGGSDQVGDVVPKSTPELLPPDNRSLAPAAGAGSTSTDADDTPTGAAGATGADADTATTSGGAAAAGPAPATPTASTPPVATTTPAATPTTPAKPAETGGADAGGFSTFCKDNPGACPE